MFRAVRKWWLSERAKQTGRLFAFELTVIMIGVFAAQQVSNWADRRADQEQVESLYGNLFYLFDAYRGIAAANQIAIPCLDKRIDLILQAANSRERIDSRLLSHTALLGMAPDQISAENEQLLRERYGNKTADTIGSVQFNLRTAERSGSEVERRWFELQRLDPRHGEITEADRSAVRDTAVQIKASLFVLRKSSDTLIRLMDKLEVPHRADMTIEPVQSCEQMWQSGKAFREAH